MSIIIDNHRYNEEMPSLVLYLRTGLGFANTFAEEESKKWHRIKGGQYNNID